MGRPTDGDSAENHTALPGQLEDAPYVPRVFAFDPAIPAELIDAATESVTVGGSAPADAASSHDPTADADASPPPEAATDVEAGPSGAAPSVAEAAPPAQTLPVDSFAVPATDAASPRTPIEPDAPTTEYPPPVQAQAPQVEPDAPTTEYPPPVQAQAPQVVTQPAPEAIGAEQTSDSWAPAEEAGVEHPVDGASVSPGSVSVAQGGDAAAAPTAEFPLPSVAPATSALSAAAAGVVEPGATQVLPTEPAAPDPTQVLPTAGGAEPGAPDPTQVLPAADAAPAAGVHPVVADPWSRPAPDLTRTQVVGVRAGTAGSYGASPVQHAGPAAAAGVQEDSLSASAGPAGGAHEPPAGPSSDPDGGAPTPPKRKGRKKALAWTAAAVVVLAGLYVGAQWYFADKIPRNASVAGVDIGGMTKSQAAKELNSKLSSRIAEPIVVTVGGDGATRKASIDPTKAGLSFDASATVDPLASFSLDPTVLWRHLAGGDAVDPVIKVDGKSLETQIAGAKETLDIDAIDGGVQFVDGKPKETKAVDGIEVDSSKARETLLANWLVSTDPVTLPTKATTPTITQAKADAAMQVANKVVSGPVVVTVGGQKAELPPDVLAKAASFKAKNGELALTFDGKALQNAVVERTDHLLTPAADAHFEFVNGKPKAVGGAAGTTLDPAALASAVATAAQGAEGSRTATVELTKSDPTQSVEKLDKLGVKEKVSEFSTPLTSEPIRTKNLIKGASKVNGTLVLPGATFSLTDTLSPITIAEGYYSAGIISDGVHTDGVGGGLSQLSTTTYNAAYFAGVDILEHRPHSYWFTRYPAGRESTMAVGSIDMKFKNDTPYGMLLQAWVSGGQVHVAIWSTKYYEVKTSDSGKQNLHYPGTVTLSDPRCVPQGKGQPGFTITNYRKVYLNSKLVKDESETWTYKPDNAVRCQ